MTNPHKLSMHVIVLTSVMIILQACTSIPLERRSPLGLPGANREIPVCLLTKKKGPTHKGEAFFVWRLAVTYSRTGTPALPSAMHRFTSEFGMGSGGSNALLPPGKLLKFGVRVKTPCTMAGTLIQGQRIFTLTPNFAIGSSVNKLFRVKQKGFGVI